MYKYAFDENDKNNVIPAALAASAIGGVSGLAASMLSKKQRKNKWRNALIGATAAPALFLAADKWGPDSVKEKLNDVSGNIYEGYSNYLANKLPTSVQGWVGSKNVNSDKRVVNAKEDAKAAKTSWDNSKNTYNSAIDALKTHQQTHFVATPDPDKAPYEEQKGRAEAYWRERDTDAKNTMNAELDKDPRKAKNYADRDEAISTTDSELQTRKQEQQARKKDYEARLAQEDKTYETGIASLKNPEETAEYQTKSKDLENAKKQRAYKEESLGATRRQRAENALALKYGPDSDASDADKAAYQKYLQFQGVLPEKIREYQQQLAEAQNAMAYAETMLDHYIQEDTDSIHNDLDAHNATEKRVAALQQEIEALNKKIFNSQTSPQYQNARAGHTKEVQDIEQIQNLLKLKRDDPKLVQQLAVIDPEVDRAMRVLGSITKNRASAQEQLNNAPQVARSNLEKQKQGWIEDYKKKNGTLSDAQAASMLMQSLNPDGVSEVIDPTSDEAAEIAWGRYFNEQLPKVEEEIRRKANNALMDFSLSPKAEGAARKTLDKVIGAAIATKRQDLELKQQTLLRSLIRENEELKAQRDAKQTIIGNLQKPNGSARRSWQPEIDAQNIIIGKQQEKIKNINQTLAALNAKGDQALQRLSPGMYAALANIEDELLKGDTDELKRYDTEVINPIDSALQKMRDNYEEGKRSLVEARDAEKRQLESSYQADNSELEAAILDIAERLKMLNEAKEVDDINGQNLVNNANQNYQNALAQNKTNYDEAIADIDAGYEAELQSVRDENERRRNERDQRTMRLNEKADLAQEARDTAFTTYNQREKDLGSARANEANRRKKRQNQALAATGGGAGALILLSALNKLRKRRKQKISPEEYLNYLEEEGLA